MALSNEASTLPTNEPIATSSTAKRRTPRKAAPASGSQAPARRVRKPSSKRAAPLGAAEDSLFTEPPNPHRTPVPPYIWIDHPSENERLGGPSYVIRLGIGGAQEVQLAIDDSPWLPCRFASGYWWYDWSAIAPGKHVLVARMRASDGRWLRTPPRACDYRR